MTELTLGPILFHWPAQQKIDFYARIADEAAIDTVYLGEVICSKRSPFFDKHYPEVTERLERGGKTVVFATLAEATPQPKRNMGVGYAAGTAHMMEINDTSGLHHMNGRPHIIGPLMNVYTEDTMTSLAAKGATRFCLPPEMPGPLVAMLCEHTRALGVSIEVQVFGRTSLALSARCYHAQAHGRIKDDCQFVCEEDPDGMSLDTLTGQRFLAINGVQTLSHTYLNMLPELDMLQSIGVSHFRLVPHTQDMVAVAQIYRDALDAKTSADEAENRLSDLDIPAPFANGFRCDNAGHRGMS